MTHCPHCKNELVIDGVSSGQQIRCAQCLTFSMIGRVEKITTDRLVWWSFWLGLSSILFLFFTGLPAIYYGVRSLLRMRFVRSEPIDRAAAIAGVGMGGCFGVVLGFLATVIGGVALFAMLTSSNTTKPTEIVELCQQHFQYKLPRGLVPISAKSILRQEHVFLFADMADEAKQHTVVCLVHTVAGFQSNGFGGLARLPQVQIADRPKGKSIVTETLMWEMNGQPTEITKSSFSRRADVTEQKTDVTDSTPSTAFVKAVESGDQTDSNTIPTAEIITIQYTGSFSVSGEQFGLTILVEPTRASLTEAEIQEIFRSLQPAMTIPARRASE